MSKMKPLSILVVLFSLLGVSAAHAEGTVVPVSTLQPAQLMDKPTLTPAGGKLIFSDTPETFDQPGAFYRDAAEGEFRVFWHHQNAAGSTLTVAVAITNESSKPVKLFSKGSGVATNVYVDVAGQDALAQFLKTHGTTNFLTTLAPGQSYFVDAPTGSNLTTSGIAQFRAVDQNGKRDAQVRVTILGYDTKPEHPEQVSVLPEQGGDLVRGTFPHFDRIGTITYHTSMGNAYKPVDSAAYGQWMDVMPGEYETGWNAVDGKSVINNGNYGVLYYWTAEFVNDDHTPRTVNMYLCPSGGYGHYTLQVNHEILSSNWLSYMDAWNFKSFTLSPNGGTYRAQMSLVGGSSGPQTIYFTNEARK